MNDELRAAVLRYQANDYGHREDVPMVETWEQTQRRDDLEMLAAAYCAEHPLWIRATLKTPAPFPPSHPVEQSP